MKRSIHWKTWPWPNLWSTTRPFCGGSTATPTPRARSSAPAPFATSMRREGPGPKRRKDARSRRSQVDLEVKLSAAAQICPTARPPSPGGHPMVRENPNAGLHQQLFRPLRQRSVQKAAAAQDHGIHTGPAGHRQDALGEAIMKIRRDHARRPTAIHECQGFTHPGSPVEASGRPTLTIWLVDQRNGEGPRFAGVGDVFKPHGGFGLVSRVLEHAGERSPGIKKTPGARRHRSAGSSQLEGREQQLPLGRCEPAMLGDFSSRLEADSRGASPGLAGRAITSDQRKRQDRADPPIMRTIHDQEFTAPDRTVIPMARAVPRDPQRGSSFAVLGQAGQNVGVMVLNGDQGQSRLLRKPRCEIVGMSVVDDHFGPDPEEPDEVSHILLVSLLRLSVSRSPMCWPRKSSLPRVKAIAALRCPPVASRGGGSMGSSIRTGASPRPIRMGTDRPPIILTTLSSAWRRMRRSCKRKASAMVPSSARATSLSTGIGSSVELPLVATKGLPAAWINARCKGV